MPDRSAGHEPPGGAAQVLRLAVAAADAYGRPDLADRARGALDRLSTPATTVVVAGEYKKGKSTFTNSLLGISTCPVDDDVSSAVPLMVRFGEEPSARVALAPEARDGSRPDDDVENRALELVPVEVDDVSGWVAEHGSPPGNRKVMWAEVAVPRKLLSPGLVLVDTPGLGGINSAHGASTMSMLPTADAVVFVTDASQELTATELSYLTKVRDLCGTVIVVVTKADLYAEWRSVVQADREHLEASGVEAEVFAVQSPLRAMATRTSDPALNEESGYSAVVTCIRDSILADGDALVRHNAATITCAVTSQLAERFEAERVALTDPDRAAALAADLEAAERRSSELGERSARWQQRLADGIQDLSGDVDHHLREHLRIVTREIDEKIENADPAKEWDDIEAQLREHVTAEVVAGFALLAERTEMLASDVAEMFRLDEEALAVPRVGLGSPSGSVDAVSLGALPDAGSRVGRVGQSLLTGARGAYGNLMMFSMAGSLVGLTMLNPVILVLGIGMGRKAVRDERKRLLTQQRQQAKVATHRYIDDVSFTVNKESRDALKRVQRTLRDDFAELAAQVQGTVAESLKAARSEGDPASRARRLADVEAELKRISALSQSAFDLDPYQRPAVRSEDG